jgi:hypothetical protein
LATILVSQALLKLAVELLVEDLPGQPFSGYQLLLLGLEYELQLAQ